MADAQLPLLGVIICCTSVSMEQRSELASIASAMGAVHRLDLTSDVTHLIVGDPDTPKYKFVARERLDVKCMLPRWIEALRLRWMEGLEISVEELESEHRLPTFQGLRLCVTGFDDLEYRKRLEDQITDNGGEYRGNLTKDITHLIAKEPSGQKYTYAQQWRIRTVSVEWLEHSLERGMILEETLYHLAIPVSERGRNAYIRRTPSTNSLGKHSRDKDAESQNTRKLRRTASSRLSDQNLALWAEISVNDTKTERNKVGERDDDRRNSSVSHERQEMSPSGKVAQLSSTNSLKRPPESRGLFQDVIFLLFGFDERKTSVLIEHLVSNGANVITDPLQFRPADEADSPKSLYQLVPYNMPESEIPKSSASSTTPINVTELWVERCLYKKKLEEPFESVTNTPFMVFPIGGFEKLSVNSTAFQGIELVQTVKALRLMGAKYEEVFTPAVSVLVCNSTATGQDKLRHAQLWEVPAVEARWLWDCIRKGSCLPFRSYLIQAIKSEGRSLDEHATEGKQNRSEHSGHSDSKLQATKTSKDKRLNRSYSTREEYKILSRKTSPVQGPQLLRAANQSRPPDLSTGPAPKAVSTLNLLDNDSTIFLDNSLNDSSTTLNPPPTSPPLREITPNSSPPKASPSPPKPLSTNTNSNPNLLSTLPPNPSPSPSLGPTISSLLAHAHAQRTANNLPRPAPSTTPNTSQPLRPRRRRHLLGRAPSNLSAQSHHNLSRASSVDTLNTDGLGTPLETAAAVAEPKSERPSVYCVGMVEEECGRRKGKGVGEGEGLQMTQLGYEDEDVRAWRERVAWKMGGGAVEGKGKGKMSLGKDVGSEGKVGEGGGLGISRRTRAAVGR